MTQSARRLAVYHRVVAQHFAVLKETRALDELMAKSLPVPESGGWLVPVCALHADDSAIIGHLSEWRRINMAAYPTQFPVSDARTAAWVKDRLLGVPDRLLFLVLTKFGLPVGHMGLANAFVGDRELEADNIMRGVKTGHRGIMTEAMRVMLDWAEEKLGPSEIFLRVFDDNDHAIDFYRRLGFVDDILLPLRRHIDGDSVTYSAPDPQDTADPDRHFLRMVYRPERDPARTMILTAGPSVSAAESWYSLDAARTGWNNQWNGYLARFEGALCEYLGVEHAIATSSCTGALHIALLALGIGPGDEVIVPDITWVATANAVLYTAATPIFADVQAGSWCLDPDSFERLITERTRAVIPVHLYGHPAEMDRIVEIARRHRLSIVEDAAPAIGAECHGRKTGTFGDFAAFSFQGAKLLVTGEGGMLVTRDRDLHHRAYTISNQGRRPGTFWIEEQGYKYKMANLLAAFGLGQLERVEGLIEAKRRIFDWYQAGLGDCAAVRLNQEEDWARSIYWMSSIVLDESAGFSREDFCGQLKERNIDTRPVFPAISQYPIWPRRQEPQPVAAHIGRQGINLPSGVCLRREQVDYVCSSIREILKA